MRLVEVEKGSVELKKGTSDSEIKKYTDKGIDVQLVDPNTEKLEEAKKHYTAEESQAVGKTVGKSLVKVLRAQGDEVVDIRLTGVGLNKFNIKVKYGNDRGQDLFKFKLNPQSEDIHIETEQGDEPLTDFLITQGNTVSLPTPELESKLAEVMKKYVSEPSPEEYDQMAAMEPESDPSQINKYIPEGVTTFKVGDKVTYLGAPGEITAVEDRYGKQYVSVAYNKGQGRTKVSGVLATNGDVQHAKALEEKQLTKPELKKREEIVKAMKKQGAPKSSKTYAIATAQAKKVAEGSKPDYIDLDKDGNTKETMKKAAQDKKSAMKEDLDIGHQDNEPGMLKSDVYRIAKMAAMLYKQLEAYEGTQEVDFPHWWQAKIIKAYDYLQSAYGYLDAEQNTNNMDTTVVTTMALQEKKGTCCHKCGHVHVKGEPHPTPYLTGKKNCKFRD